MYKFEFESTIKSGLSVIVEAQIAPADPSVGLPNDYIEDLIVRWKSGHKVKFKIPTLDLLRLEQEANERLDLLIEERKCIKRYGASKCHDLI